VRRSTGQGRFDWRFSCICLSRSELSEQRNVEEIVLKEKKMRQTKAISLRAFFAIMVLTTASFAAADIKSDYDRGYSLDKLHFFRFAEMPQRFPADALTGDEIVSKRLRNAIERNLISAGYAAVANADFVVTYRAALRNQAQVTTSGFPRLGGGRVLVDNYTLGTVIVEFRDAKSGDLVWRGSVSGAIDPDKSEEKINDGIKKLIDRFQKDRERQRKTSR